VHKYFLVRESAYFRLRLGAPTLPGQGDPPGSSEANPLVLDEATSDAFACFLWVFYNPCVIIPFPISPDINRHFEENTPFTMRLQSNGHQS
jgi:hypothetical protein